MADLCATLIHPEFYDKADLKRDLSRKLDNRFMCRIGAIYFDDAHVS